LAAQRSAVAWLSLEFVLFRYSGM